MVDTELSPDTLAKTSGDDIKLTETELDDVSGGSKNTEDAFKKTSPVEDYRPGNNFKIDPIGKIGDV